MLFLNFCQAVARSDIWFCQPPCGGHPLHNLVSSLPHPPSTDLNSPHRVVVVVCACRGVKCLLLARLLLSDVVTQNRAGEIGVAEEGLVLVGHGSWSCLVPRPSFL